MFVCAYARVYACVERVFLFQGATGPSGDTGPRGSQGEKVGSLFRA